ncbi:MAG: adenylate cyclase [Actinobacteria bacterium]|nr:MAG: adenylate cyclase [Actinomycetota bacterium]
MAETTAERPAVSGDDLQKLVALLKNVDTVELKLTVPEPDQLSTVRALELDSLQAQLRQVFFFETPDLALDKAGVVVRARRSQKKGDDTVVKLRPVVPSELPKELRRSPDFGVEVDVSPKGFVCSGSLKGVPTGGDVRKTALSGKQIRKLFTKEQRALFEAHAPEGELWLYPDGSRILELSTKCEPGEAFQVAAETRAFLASKGVDLGSEQQTKTRSALEFFSKQLANGGAVDKRPAKKKRADASQREASPKAASTTAESRP